MSGLRQGGEVKGGRQAAGGVKRKLGGGGEKLQGNQKEFVASRENIGRNPQEKSKVIRRNSGGIREEFGGIRDQKKEFGILSISPDPFIMGYGRYGGGRNYPFYKIKEKEGGVLMASKAHGPE